MTSIGRTKLSVLRYSQHKTGLSLLRCGRYDVTNCTNFWQHKVHFNYLKSLNSTFFKQCWMHWSDSPFKSFLKSVLWSDRKQSNLYFHSAYSLSVIYNPLPVVHFFPARNTTRGTPSYRLMESNLSFLTLLWRDIPLVIRSRSF